MAAGPRASTIAALDALGVVDPERARRQAAEAEAEQAVAAQAPVVRVTGEAKHGELWTLLKRKQAANERLHAGITKWYELGLEELAWDFVFKVMTALGLNEQL